MLSDALSWLLHGSIPVGSGALSVREVVGNLFGLGSALLGMRRVVWAWPVGLVGNLLLLTVFVSGELGDLGGAATEPLWGQAGRQVMFIIVGLYGWSRWRRARRTDADAQAVSPHWAAARERGALLVVAVVGYALAYVVLREVGSYGPATEAWILAGSLVATGGMACGWVEFWLVWIAVDVVGVTSLVRAGYYPTAGMYLFYGAFCVVGFVSWWRVSRRPDHARPDSRTTLEGATR